MRNIRRYRLLWEHKEEHKEIKVKIMPLATDSTSTLIEIPAELQATLVRRR